MNMINLVAEIGIEFPTAEQLQQIDTNAAFQAHELLGWSAHLAQAAQQGKGTICFTPKTFTAADCVQFLKEQGYNAELKTIDQVKVRIGSWRK